MNKTKSKIVIIKIKKVFIVNEKNGIRYKVIAEDGNEYRFF
jgi:competence protein ComGF